MKIEIDIKKATKKWTPVLDSLKVKESHREKMAEYAEHHQIVETLNNSQQNYLPVSLKLLSELIFDIEMVIFNCESLKDHTYEIDITDEQIILYNCASQTSNALAFVQDLEKQLIENIKTDIQNKLNDDIKIEINILIKEIGIDIEKKKMFAVSNYKQHDRQQKLKRIIKK